MPSRRRPPEPLPVEVPQLTPEAIERGVVGAILEICGPNSPHSRDNQYHQVWHGPIPINAGDQQCRQRFTAGIPQTTALVEGLIANIEERMSEHRDDPNARVRAALQDLDLHARIIGVVADPYRDGHFRDAMPDASPVLVSHVKEQSRRCDLDE